MVFEFAPFTAWTLLEFSPKVHRSLNRNTDFFDNYRFEELLKEIENIDTHVDIGTGPESPCAETVIEELDVSQSIGLDLIDYENQGAKCGYKFSNPVYGRKSENNHQFIKANGLKLPINDCEADLVTLGRYLNNIEPEKWDKALSEVERVLKPGGYVAGDLKITKFVRPHEMLQYRTLGTQEVVGRLLREEYAENWEEKLNEYFENVSSGISWIDESNRPYVQAFYFVAEKSETP